MLYVSIKIRGSRHSVTTLLHDSTAFAASTVVFPEPTTPFTLQVVDVSSKMSFFLVRRVLYIFSIGKKMFGRSKMLMEALI